MAEATIQNQKINKFVRQAVIEAIREIFNDPDYGLPLTPQTIRRLKQSIKSKKAGRVTKFEEILKKYSK